MGGQLVDFPLGAVVAVADLFACYEVFEDTEERLAAAAVEHAEVLVPLVCTNEQWAKDEEAARG